MPSSQARYTGDIGEMYGRYRGDAREIQGPCRAARRGRTPGTIFRLYLAEISRTSPLYLPYISPGEGARRALVAKLRALVAKGEARVAAAEAETYRSANLSWSGLGFGLGVGVGLGLGFPSPNPNPNPNPDQG